VARAARLTADGLPDRYVPEDVEAVQDMHRRVQLALAGDAAGAYDDRAGETRSI
jgi:hypothetical protein